MLASASTGLFGFVFWIVAARLYTTDVVGIASAIISVAALLETICFLGLGYGLIRFLQSSTDPIKLINSSLTLTGLLSLAAAGIFIVGLNIWSPSLSIIRENPFYMVIFLLYVPMLVLDDLTDHIMIGKRRAMFSFAHILIFNISRLALLVLLVVFSRSFGIVGSWSAATLIALLISLFLLLPRAQPGYRLCFVVDKKEFSGVLNFSFLNYLSDLFWSVPGLVLPIIVLNLLGAKSNAYFYMAWTMSSILTMIPMGVSVSLLAEGAYDETKLKTHVKSSLKMITILLIPAAVIIWFLANQLLRLYGGLYAENAVTLLRWLVIAAFPSAINIVYFNIKRVQKIMKPVIILTAFMAFIAISVSYLLLPRLGINGVGIAWLSAQSAIAIVVVFWDLRRWVLR
jgi:O-antigen/teichoic acid export membrane protein